MEEKERERIKKKEEKIRRDKAWKKRKKKKEIWAMVVLLHSQEKTMDLAGKDGGFCHKKWWRHREINTEKREE